LTGCLGLAAWTVVSGRPDSWTTRRPRRSG